MRRYEDAGFDNIVIWADRVWPEHGSLAHKRDAMLAAAERILVR